MELIDLLNKMRERLPVYRLSGKSYKETLKYEFNEYNSLLSQVDETELKDLFVSVNSNKGTAITKKTFTKRRLINFITRIEKTIICGIEKYEHGYPNEAFLSLYNLLKHNKFVTIKSQRRKNYVDDPFGEYFKKSFEQEFSRFYRMRKSEKTIEQREELFHVPFQLREKVATARFSISGYPCLYLGSSLEVCQMEIGDAKMTEKLYACQVQVVKSLAFIDLKIPLPFNTKFVEEKSFDVFRFLITYPFFSACLMEVEKPDETFKPEYVVPQLLLQYVMKEAYLDGIAYTSTKDKMKIGEKYNNFVIPTRKISDTGYCECMKRWLYLTDVIEVKTDEFTSNAATLETFKAKKL